MNIYCRSIFLKVTVALVCLASACGGGGGSNSVDANVSAAKSAAIQPNSITPKLLTNVTVESTASTAQSSIPITFGQPFKIGDLPPGASLASRDNLGNRVPLQLDEISTHADGSVRFAVISAQIANLQPNEQRVIDLKREPATQAILTPPVSINNFDPKLVATVYSPQISVITFGNRVGTTAGTPYLEGEQITLQLGDTNPEQYVLTVSATQAGGGYQTLTKIAEGFMALINASSQNYLASKPGEGGGYEKLWITTKKADGRTFGIKFVYTGTAMQTLSHLQTYQAPRTYQASPRQVLDVMIAAQQSPRLSGLVASEYTVVAPFVEVTTGTRHPQLIARLHTRFVDGGQRVRTDMVIENNWTYEPNPGNITYALTVTQGGQTIHHQPIFVHNHHARWHKVLWTGAEPQAQVRHNMRYFLDSKFTWNYDLSLDVPESVLASEATGLAKADTNPMGAVFLETYFPTTGGRSDIGPLPRWTALYLVTQDLRARASMLANADAAAGIPVHYRDLPTDQPVSIEKHPGLAMQLGPSTTVDALPPMRYDLTVWSADVSHQASFAYIPYAVTGDAFYLDEIMFWANWNMGRLHPGYRGGARGLVNDEQVRGQAWALRSLGEAAHALPDSHAMKKYFTERLTDNLAWYVGVYPPRNPNDAELSPLGLVERGTTQLQNSRPWMNDFMAIVLGQLAERGEPFARTYLDWVSKFTVGRFAADELGYCIQKAAAYTLVLLDSNGKQFTNLGQVFGATWPTITACTPLLDVDGYPELATGAAATSRAMLAVSASLGIENANAAYKNWLLFTPKMQANFSQDATWAIVPRN